MALFWLTLRDEQGRHLFKKIKCHGRSAWFSSMNRTKPCRGTKLCTSL